MKQAGSAKVVFAAVAVAASIIAVKTIVPAIPLPATVVASVLGLVLIFWLYRTDLRHRLLRHASEPQAATELHMDESSIRNRLERRPLPQISPGPLSRDRVAPPAHADQTGPHPAMAGEAPVLELVHEDADPEHSVLELTDKVPNNAEVLELTAQYALPPRAG